MCLACVCCVVLYGVLFVVYCDIGWIAVVVRACLCLSVFFINRVLCDLFVAVLSGRVWLACLYDMLCLSVIGV